LATATLTRTKVERPLKDVKASRRQEIIRDLNTSLATNLDLFLVPKQAHWNVKGPNFQGLHELFDEVAAAAREYADLVAERASALGGVAHGTVQDVGSATGLAKMSSTETKWEPLARAVHASLVATSEQARRFASDLDDDMASQDIYVEMIRGLDKWAWMVESHLG